MINITRVATNPHVSACSSKNCTSAPSGEETDSVSFGGRDITFEPYFPPTANIEPWQRGEPTNDPGLSTKFADKVKSELGESGLLSIKDERISGISGYFFEGWESVGGDDWLAGRTLGRLGEGWEMTGYGNYQLKSGDVTQKLSFNMGSRQTVLETSYDEEVFDTTRFTEILHLDSNGSMRREHPAQGL